MYVHIYTYTYKHIYMIINVNKYIYIYIYICITYKGRAFQEPQHQLRWDALAGAKAAILSIK